jgi:hypothetical protein
MMKRIAAVLAALAVAVAAPTVASAYDGDGDGMHRGWSHDRTQRNVMAPRRERPVGDVMAPDRRIHNNVGDVMAPSRTHNPVGDVMAPSR